MKKRIHDFVTINTGYKLLSLLLAFALWMVVYNSEDPSKTATFTVPVTLENTEAVTMLDKYFVVIDNTGVVSFSVTAKRSVLDKLAGSDFAATADMKGMLVSEDGKTGSVPIEISPNRYSGQIQFNNRTKYLQVSLENLETQQFVVSANTAGTPAPGYALGTVKVAAPNLLKVSGPVSVVERIASVTATINVEGMSQDISDNVIPVLLDEEGQVIDHSTLTLSNDTVTVEAKMYKTKVVTVETELSGVPAADYRITSTDCDRGSILVKGTSAILNQVSSISIPAEVLNVAEITEDKQFDIDIIPYLPEGLDLVDRSLNMVKVTVHVRRYATANFYIHCSALEMNGLDAAYEGFWGADGVTLTLTGPADMIETMTAAEIRGSVDLTDCNKAGEYQPVITIALDRPYEWKDVKIPVTVRQKGAPAEGSALE